MLVCFNSTIQHELFKKEPFCTDTKNISPVHYSYCETALPK